MTAPPRPFTSDAVQMCLHNRNWQLISPRDLVEWEHFLDEVAKLLHDGDLSSRPLAERLKNAVTGAYCAVLYVACSANGTQRQRRAYTEVREWVFRYVVADGVRIPDDADDVTQEVLLTVFQELGKVSQPDRFLAWVGRIAYNRLKRYYRQKQQQGRRFITPPLDEAADDEANPTWGDGGQVEMVQQVEMSVAEIEILELIEACMPRRAYLQKAVFIERCLRQKTVSEVAQELRITAANVCTALFHATRTIKKHCPKLIERLIEHFRPSKRAEHIGVAP